MENIPPDCLTQIFLRLHFLERVKLERVCRLWYHVLQNRSCFSDMQDLNIANFLSNTTTDYFQQECLSLEPTIIGVVIRCGTNVRNLSFGNRWLKVSQNIIDCITDNCVRLTQVDFGAVILNADISELLLNISNNLKHLSLEETSWVCNEHAEKVPETLASMSALHSINLRSALFNIEAITFLPHSLREINISGAKKFPVRAMVNFLCDHPKLRILSASPCPVISQEIIDALSALSCLETLELGFIDDRNLDLVPLAALTHLDTLRFQNVQCLTEHSLLLLLTSLSRLHVLSLQRCSRIRDYSSVGFCDQLSSLTITNTHELCDDDLLLIRAPCSLSYINFSHCSNVTSTGMIHLLLNFQIHELNLLNCVSITDDTLHMITRTQNEITHICIQGCTRITSKGVATLGFLRNLRMLRQLDVSRNREVDDFAVLSLHNALSLAWRRAPCLSSSDSQCDKMTREHSSANVQPLTLIVTRTSVSQAVEENVGDLIQLAY